MKNINFLTGLPRSGSTVLAAILNQHPSIYATASSGLLDLLVNTLKGWRESITVQSAIDDKKKDEEILRVLRNICQIKYEKIDKPIILDKAKGWSSDINISTMTEVLGYRPKIIATVRNIPDCVASFIRVAKPEDKYEFLRTSDLVSHVKESYQTLQSSFVYAPNSFLFVDYDDLMRDPSKELNRIHKFLDLPDHTYNFYNLDGTNLIEKDKKIWNIKGFHDVKPKLGYQHNEDPKDVLGHSYRNFVQPKFWCNETVNLGPIHKLDLQLAAGLVGNFEEGLRLSNELEVEEPWNNRAAFNRGWYKLREDKLLEGEQLLYRGRFESVFGNPLPNIPTPMWDGVSRGTVILYLEGGLGDQFHGARYAEYIMEKGCEVIIACSGLIATLLRKIKGVKAVIQHEAVFGVVHDFWTPSMSTVLPLKLEYKDIKGTAYINKSDVDPHYGMKIGIRWQGNPAFEHAQHRIFPPDLMFKALKGTNAEFISLQRDEGSELCPSWVNKVPLNTWEDTRNAIASCDLVISSCTSVAHLSAAMGVQTWIVVPILPYYLWAKEGDTTPWYDSVTLFRQEAFGDWTSPFEKINLKLAEMQKNKHR